MDLFTLIQADDLDGLKQAIAKNVFDINQQNQKGSAPLHLAAIYANPEMVMTLLAAKANVNIKDAHENTPLHFAAANENPECMRALFWYNAQPNFQNQFGDTPLHWAAKYGHIGGIQLLLSHKADPTIINLAGQTPDQVSLNSGIQQIIHRTEVSARTQSRPFKMTLN